MAVIEIGGVDYDLRPTWGVQDRIEQRLKTSLHLVYDAHRSNALTLSDLGVIVFEGFFESYKDEKLSEQKTIELIYVGRVTDPAFRRSIAEYILEMLYSPSDLKKKLADHWDGADPGQL